MFQHVAAIVIPIWRGAHCRLERCLTDNTTKAPSDCQRNQLNFATGCNCSWTKRVMSNKSNNVPIASAAYQSCISWLDDLTARCRWSQQLCQAMTMRTRQVVVLVPGRAELSEICAMSATIKSIADIDVGFGFDVDVGVGVGVAS